MASIKIYDLNHSESSLSELTEEEIMYVSGGKFPWLELLSLVGSAIGFIAAL
ncbi:MULTISPECIES: class IIb bacteriocin, lactobin A/cerein 7B family [unclassified Microcoleus]|uniref:class IIb bacteriocin, lactobin A/cerein 7B family n=1 Tax=unclassified Microcoleus TaxID=2642155 RepID=UPI002FCF4528